VFDRYSIASRRVILCAWAEASMAGAKVIDTEHLLLGVLRVDPATLRLIAPPITLESVREFATRWHVPENKVPTHSDLPLSSDLPFSPDAKFVLDKSDSLAHVGKFAFVRTEHLLLALMTATTSHAALILQEANASVSHLEQLVSALHGDEQQDGDPSWSEGWGTFWGEGRSFL
jgi:ATP-dependent Clp protease ATP-binding subunit ClpA